MILPSSYALSITILILGLLCWGCWAATFKMTESKWRFELFYLDFAVGVLLAALIAGFTFGTLGWDGFSLPDELRMAGKRQDTYALVAGCLFNLGNILLVGAVSLAGLAVAFPLTMGVALLVGALLAFGTGGEPIGIPELAGCGMVLIAVVLIALAGPGLSRARRETTMPPETLKGKQPKPENRYKGIIAALAGGVFMGLFPRLAGMARAGENGLGPYSLCVVFAVGVLLSTMVYDIFLMNLPLQGKPIELSAFFRGGARQHALGLLGGILWMTGALCIFVAGRAEGPAQAGSAAIWVAAQAAPVLAALLGILFWKEVAGASGKVKSYMAAGLFLYLGGIAAATMGAYSG